MLVPRVDHRFVDVDGTRLFYREAGPSDAPTVLLLHGFPSASHQFRRLIDALGDRFHLVAPDYPGFGHSDAPDPDRFEYSFDHLATVIEAFCEVVGLRRFVLYMFDYGGPIGLRLATRRPEWIAGLVVQHANAYDDGLSDVARELIAIQSSGEEAAERLQQLLTLPVTRSQYEGGADAEAIAPDGWTLDQHFLDLPGRQEIQIALHLDYHTNVDQYTSWQAWLREHQPPTLIVWGRNDAFFTEAGARAYQRDLPSAELHLFDTGHFALEDKLGEIAPLVADFLSRTWRAEPKRIAVIGASGHLGGAIAREAVERGHQVTAIARDATRLDALDGVSIVAADVLDPAAVAGAVRGHDAVVVAVKGPVGTAPAAAGVLVNVLPTVGVHRLVFVGGGGSLEVEPGMRFLDAPGFPRQYRPEALAQAEALDRLRDEGDALDWSYASPPPVDLVDGERVGVYRVTAGDRAVTDADGQSRLSVEDFAAAVVDAVETGDFVRQRFTAGY